MPIEAVTLDSIAKAAGVLRAGGLIGMPTETVYGLAADATQGRAVAAVFEAKGRPAFNPLIVHVLDQTAARALGAFGPLALRLAEAFWPGPLTLVVRKAPGSPVHELTTAGLDTIAIRVPRHPVARAVLAAAGCPIAAPSANRSGHVSPTLAAHVAADLGPRVALILDGGPAEVGLESTVVDATGDVPVLLRQGGITADEIAAVARVAPQLATEGGVRPMSPGQLLAHYAPSIPVRLGAMSVAAGEALLAFGPDTPPTQGPMINLSQDGDLREAAANLFAALRTLDAPGTTAIAVMPIPDWGLGAAINDRLTRAARD
jgi:L-threonylcarbamoyladenylate synthase